MSLKSMNLKLITAFAGISLLVGATVLDVQAGVTQLADGADFVIDFGERQAKYPCSCSMIPAV